MRGFRELVGKRVDVSASRWYHREVPDLSTEFTLWTLGGPSSGSRVNKVAASSG